MHTPKQKISALVITYNETGYIEECLNSVEFADEIIVIDSFSTDGTYEYLRDHPRVKVIQNPFENFTSQKSFALKQATNDWILFLDADEVIPGKLKNQIIKAVNSNQEYVAYWFYRKFMFQNKHLRFSGWQTDKNCRLFRKSKVQFTSTKLVHETLEVHGASTRLSARLIHFCYKTYEDYKSKMVFYGQLKAEEIMEGNIRFNYLCLLVKPTWKFFYNYIIRLGILDGTKGVTICYLDAYTVWIRYKELARLQKMHASETKVVLSTSS